MESQKKLPREIGEKLISSLKSRFEKNLNRHQNIEWEKLQTKLEACQSENSTDSEKLWSLYEMERTGGEPDVVGFDSETGKYIYYDCSPETPKERRSVCYDREGLESRKQHKPKNNAVDMAADMGVEILNEEQYRHLQELGNFDTKTSSWILTPNEIRKLGGALFADFRYGKVFIYHNSAPSYYSVRGFRGALKI